MLLHVAVEQPCARVICLEPDHSPATSPQRQHVLLEGVGQILCRNVFLGVIRAPPVGPVAGESRVDIGQDGSRAVENLGLSLGNDSNGSRALEDLGFN